MSIGNLIKNRRIALGLTMKDVANAVGVSEATVSRWEAGEISNMKRNRISALANILNISPLEIMGDVDFNNTVAVPSNIYPVTLKKFPLLGEIACGKPIFAEEDHESYIMASRDIKADFCLIAKGDSMIGARINDGDVVFIHEQPMVENGEIAAVIIDGEATLKRWYYYPEKQKLLLAPANEKYEPFIYVGEELNEIRCLGKAVCFMSNL